MRFAERYRALFHVTRRSAVDRIRADGLLSAAQLIERGGGLLPAGVNRDDWTPCRRADGTEAWLRWQRLSDRVLLSRLPSDTTPAAWRRLIDGMVFFCVAEADAEALRRFPRDAGIDQVILRFDTEAVLAAAPALRFCPWNNGFPDRRRPPRLRDARDYRPVAEWRRGDRVREVTASGGLPQAVPFTVGD